jgi:hypothetical protein
MLVHDIEIMNQPERLLHSDVWLYQLDHVSSLWSDLLYFSLSNGRCVLLRGLADRKVSIPIWHAPRHLPQAAMPSDPGHF